MPVTSVSIRKRTKVSQQMRDQIVLEHLPLVKAIAIRVHENLPVHVDMDDLIHDRPRQVGRRDRPAIHPR